MGWTNLGKKLILEAVFRGTWDGGTLPARFYLALCTGSIVPDCGIQTLGELDEIAAGNGYESGGEAIEKNSEDFDVLDVDVDFNKGYIQIKDISWTASGGTIPSDASSIQYAVLTDDNAVISNRKVIGFWDLVDPIILYDTDILRIVDNELDITEPIFGEGV